MEKMNYAQFQQIAVLLAVNGLIKEEWRPVQEALELAVNGYPFSNNLLEVAYHIYKNVL